MREPPPAWCPDWSGECVAIIAAGPSAKTAGVELLRDRIHVIAINESYRLAPWADMLYACDGQWWELKKGLPEFEGIRIGWDIVACNKYKLHRLHIENPASDDLLLDRPTYVGAAGNSSFQAMNFAVQLGATGIMLIGVDCTLEHGEHWHGRHPSPMTNPCPSNILRWRKGFEGAAGRLRKAGVDVVNCSPISALTSYPKMTVKQALERWQL